MVSGSQYFAVGSFFSFSPAASIFAGPMAVPRKSPIDISIICFKTLSATSLSAHASWKSVVNLKAGGGFGIFFQEHQTPFLYLPEADCFSMPWVVQFPLLLLLLVEVLLEAPELKEVA